MISAFGKFFRSLFVGFLALFKRALCFLSRKRRNSGAILPTHVKDAAVNIPAPAQLSDNFQFPASLENHTPQPEIAEEITEEAYTQWDSWDQPALSAPDSVPRQHYSSNSSKPAVIEPEPEPDYFSDLGLAPTIKKQKKVLVKSAVVPPNHVTERSNRLAFIPDSAVPLSADLEEWDDTAGAWEDEDVTLEAEEAFRQSRKAERLAEHQRRNQEKEQRKLSKDSGLRGTKLRDSQMNAWGN